MHEIHRILTNLLNTMITVASEDRVCNLWIFHAKNTAMACEVRPVHTRKEWKAFFRFPWIVYQGDRWWVPPLLMDVKEMFNRKKNPFFDHADIQPYVAWEGDEPVGRVVAIHNQAHNEFHRESMGFFGFFECVDRLDVALALFARAEEWCRAHGASALRGPANFSSNDEWGLLVDGFGSSPYFMMPYNPKYYVELIEGCEFKKAKDVYAFYLSLSKVSKSPERFQRIVERIRKREQVIVRPIRMDRYREELEHVKEIYNGAWADNWGFVPMTDRELDHMAKKLKPLILPDTVLFAEVKGEVAGLALALPNYNEVIKGFNGRLGPIKIAKLLLSKRRLKSGRGMIVGVKRKFRRKGLDALLIADWHAVGMRLGYTGGEVSWVLEDNKLIIRDIEAAGCERYKTYRIYDRPIR